MRCLNFIYRILILALLASAADLRAQNTTPAQGSAMMQLMLSQPPVDITSPVVVDAKCDPPAVRPGQKATYRITLNAAESAIQLPDQIPAPPGLKIQRTVQGQIFRPMGNGLRPQTSINFDVRATAPGMYLVPSFYLAVYGRPVVVPAVGLEVSSDVEEGLVARQIELEASATNVYIGETFTVRVQLPATISNTVEVLREVQLNGDGFMVEKNSSRQTIGSVWKDGKVRTAFVYDIAVTPIAAGPMKLTAQGFTAGREFSGPITITGQLVLPGTVPDYMLLESDPLPINVRMLPPEGELPGFKGALGNLSRDEPTLSTNVLQVGEPVELTVAVRTDGNLSRLMAPDPPRVRGWQVFPAFAKGMVPPGAAQTPGLVFSYTMIPLTEDLRQTPAIPFSGFDLKKGRYVDLTIPSLPIKLLDAAAGTNAPVFALATEPDAPQKKLTLSGLISTPGPTARSLRPLQMQGWFLGVQVLPLLALGGLWWWDQRRRFLERHPEIVRCRRARRELRGLKRELARTAQAGDSAGFGRTAVQALQVVCAPQYPANPRALVAADVLAVLPPEARAGQLADVARRLFAASDAQSFATTPSAAGELLARKSDVAELLHQLEGQLCA